MLFLTCIYNLILEQKFHQSFNYSWNCCWENSRPWVYVIKILLVSLLGLDFTAQPCLERAQEEQGFIAWLLVLSQLW